MNERQSVGEPFVWRVSLASSPERVFELLDTDEGRERFWAQQSRAAENGFDLRFKDGLEGRVIVVEREPPTRMAILYFGGEAELDLTAGGDGGCIVEVTCSVDDPAAWLEFYPGWVSWLQGGGRFRRRSAQPHARALVE